MYEYNARYTILFKLFDGQQPLQIQTDRRVFICPGNSNLLPSGKMHEEFFIIIIFDYPVQIINFASPNDIIQADDNRFSPNRNGLRFVSLFLEGLRKKKRQNMKKRLHD